MKHDVGEQVGGTCKVLLQHSAIIHRLLLGSISIKVAAHALQPVGYVAGAAPRGALKRHVFYKVCHAAVGLGLMARAGTHHIAAVEHGRRAVFIYHPQSAGQSCLVVCHYRLKYLPTTGRFDNGKS